MLLRYVCVETMKKNVTLTHVEIASHINRAGDATTARAESTTDNTTIERYVYAITHANSETCRGLRQIVC